MGWGVTNREFSIQEFNIELLKFLGLQNRLITELDLHIKVGDIPTLKIVELASFDSSIEIKRHFEFIEVDGN